MSENAKKRILVIDDEADVAELLGHHLRTKDYEVETLTEATKAVARARQFRPDLAILDVMMPGVTGIQVCRMLRADPLFAAIPVLFLTAKTEEGDRIAGLEAGADDYVAKPFSIKELMLRVQALLRRANSLPEPPAALVTGGISIDCDRHTVSLHGELIDLTATEYKLLKLLMERKGRVQTREHLLLTVWNYATEIETRTVDTHIRRLREKLGTESVWIETIRGVGYRMLDEKPRA